MHLLWRWNGCDFGSIWSMVGIHLGYWAPALYPSYPGHTPPPDKPTSWKVAWPSPAKWSNTTCVWTWVSRQYSDSRWRLCTWFRPVAMQWSIWRRSALQCQHHHPRCPCQAETYGEGFDDGERNKKLPNGTIPRILAAGEGGRQIIRKFNSLEYVAN